MDNVISKMLKTSITYFKSAQMKEVSISINPLAEFLLATDKRRIKILEEQINPDIKRVPYYSKARHIAANYVLNSNKNILQREIESVSKKEETKWWHPIDKRKSVEALTNLKEMILPEEVANSTLEKVRVKEKSLLIYGVRIKISPSLVYRIRIGDYTYLGAMKVHISDSKKFTTQQSSLVAQIIYMYLSRVVAEENDIVLPQLCFCLDLFSKTTVTAHDKISYEMGKLSILCNQLLDISRGNINNQMIA